MNKSNNFSETLLFGMIICLTPHAPKIATRVMFTASLLLLEEIIRRGISNNPIVRIMVSNLKTRCLCNSNVETSSPVVTSQDDKLYSN